MLWRCIGLRQHCRACLLKNLRLSKLGSFNGKVSVCILDLAAVVNSTTFIRLETVYSSLFWPAPHSALYLATCSMAPVITSSAPGRLSTAGYRQGCVSCYCCLRDVEVCPCFFTKSVCHRRQLCSRVKATQVLCFDVVRGDLNDIAIVVKTWMLRSQHHRRFGLCHCS